jgi:hypothetical protein
MVILTKAERPSVPSVHHTKGHCQLVMLRPRKGGA